MNSSPDGRFVAFYSDASNLVRGDITKAPDVFLHDRVTGLTIHVSVSNTGTQGYYESLHTALSADGRMLVLPSRASSLVGGTAAAPTSSSTTGGGRRHLSRACCHHRQHRWRRHHPWC